MSNEYSILVILLHTGHQLNIPFYAKKRLEFCIQTEEPFALFWWLQKWLLYEAINDSDERNRKNQYHCAHKKRRAARRNKMNPRLADPGYLLMKKIHRITDRPDPNQSPIRVAGSRTIGANLAASF